MYGRRKVRPAHTYTVCTTVVLVGGLIHSSGTMNLSPGTRTDDVEAMLQREGEML